MTTMTKRIALATALVALGSTPALARKSPLAKAPDVRDKYELRLKRFEVSPTLETTLAADYQHTVSGGAKLEFHLSDSLSIGGLIFFGGGVSTALTDSISGSLPDTTTGGDPTPTRAQFEDHLNTMPLHGAAEATFTPWFGKLALFGKAYLAFDVYVSGGLGFASLKTNFSGTDNCKPTGDGTNPMTGETIFNDPRNDAPCNSGFRMGGMVGAGMHIFFNKWIALDISFRDYLFKDNPSGQDFDADGKVDDSDPRFMSHLFFGLGVSLYLPPKVKITH